VRAGVFWAWTNNNNTLILRDKDEKVVAILKRVATPVVNKFYD
jgi:hypothetical protein